MFMLVLVALKSEAKVFHLVTEIAGSNPTSDNVDDGIPDKSATAHKLGFC
jgi:hypothetical protein